jgi:hypothetical protein
MNATVPVLPVEDFNQPTICPSEGPVAAVATPAEPFFKYPVAIPDPERVTGTCSPDVAIGVIICEVPPVVAISATPNVALVEVASARSNLAPLRSTRFPTATAEPPLTCGRNVPL